MNKTKHCKYHHNHGYNTKDYWALKDKIKKLIQAGYLSQFTKKLDDNRIGGKFRGHHDDHRKMRDADRRRDQIEEKGRHMCHPQRRERQP